MYSSIAESEGMLKRSECLKSYSHDFCNRGDLEVQNAL